MRVMTVQFDYSSSKLSYERLLRAFVQSVEEAMPGTVVDVVQLRPPLHNPKRGNTVGFTSNTYKLRYWVDYVEKLKEPAMICDCDMLMLDSVESVFNEDFDVAYTVRDKLNSSKLNHNNGVMFVKSTEGARRFFHEWERVNRQMYIDKLFHMAWRKKYTGMNQAAFGYLLHNPVPNVKLKPLPCSMWNACDETWKHVFDVGSKVVHVKSHLRGIVLSGMQLQNMAERLRPLVKYWRECEERSTLGRDLSESA